MSRDSSEVKTGSQRGLNNMANYCITFRIANKTVAGKTYEERRQILIDNVYTESGYWDEPTSFILAYSTLDTASFADMACKGLSKADDLLFIFDPEDRSAYYFGPVKETDVLHSFFPSLKKVP